MNKIIKILVLLLSVLLLFGSCSKLKKDTVFIKDRVGYDKGLTIGEYRVSDIYRVSSTDYNITLQDADDIDDFMSEMKKCPEFVAEREFFIYGKIYKGNYYYKDRNSYFLYNADNVKFSAVNLQTYDINFGTAESPVPAVFPIPGLLMIYTQGSEYYEEQLSSEIDGFFKAVSYSDAFEFYKHYPSGFIIADPLTQTLSVTAYINGEYSETEKGIIDFKNQNIGYLKADGTILWLLKQN